MIIAIDVPLSHTMLSRLLSLCGAKLLKHGYVGPIYGKRRAG
jgi:hypothetical protein